MPLLKREVEFSPLNLFELSEAELPWWVAFTRSRQEKAFARHLVRLGIPFFLPQWEKHSQRGGRHRISHLPLFPGYVFFRGSPDVRLRALSSRLLARVLEVADQGCLHRELAQLRLLQQSGAALAPFEEFGPGEEVRVKEGPFRGCEGVVVRDRTRLRLVVSVSFLRKSVAVEFDRFALEHRQTGTVHRGNKVAAG